MCLAGSCSQSICALWNLTLCTGDAGESACEVKCRLDSGQCIAPPNIPFARTMNVSVWGPDEIAAEGLDFDVRYKAPGSSCEFEQGLMTSGVCNTEGTCVSADSEGKALSALYGQYGQQLNDLGSWVEDDESGVPRYVWVIICFVFMMAICCGLCYVANNPAWEDGLDEFCHKRCMCCHDDIEPWDPVKNRQRRELVKLGSHGVKKKKLPPVLGAPVKVAPDAAATVDESDQT